MDYTEEECPECKRVSILSESNDYMCRDCFNYFSSLDPEATDELDDWRDFLESRDQG